MNEIYLRRRMRLHVRPGSGGVTPEQLATMLKELEPLGFVLADEVVSRLRSLSHEEAVRTICDATRDISKLLGAHRRHERVLLVPVPQREVEVDAGHRGRVAHGP